MPRWSKFLHSRNYSQLDATVYVVVVAVVALVAGVASLASRFSN